MNKYTFILGAVVVLLLVFVGYLSLKQLPEPQIPVGAAGDTASSSRTAIISGPAGSSTLCSLYNFGSRPRFMTDWFIRINAASTTNLTAITVATSSGSALIPTSSSAFFNVTAVPATSASTTYIASSTLPTGVTELVRRIWPASTYVNFVGSSSIAFGGGAICGVNYFIDN